MEGAEWWDNERWGVGGVEGAVMDPQHRLLVECAAEVCESAGLLCPCPSSSSSSSSSCSFLPPLLKQAGWEAKNKQVGVFLGVGGNEWEGWSGVRKGKEEIKDDAFSFLVGRGGLPDTAPARVAYHLGLEGPAHAIQVINRNFYFGNAI